MAEFLDGVVRFDLVPNVYRAARPLGALMLRPREMPVIVRPPDVAVEATELEELATHSPNGEASLADLRTKRRVELAPIVGEDVAELIAQEMVPLTEAEQAALTAEAAQAAQ